MHLPLPLLPASLLAAAAISGCGSQVVTAAAAGGTGGGSSSGSTTIASSATSSGSSSSSSSASSTTSSSGATSCGGDPGHACAADQFCFFSNEECGETDGAGVCTARPEGCPQDLDPACGCDGKVYANACAAMTAGTDISDLGGCTAPAGQFGCGAHFCVLGMQYCQRTVSDSGGLDGYACPTLPAACGASPSCACLSTVQCGTQSCGATSDGGLLVTCPGL